MNRGFKGSVLTILLLIPLTLLIPNMGFGGAEPCEGTTVVLPAYFGNLTAEWVPQCETSNFGCVLIYGRLNSAERGYNDIIIKKREPIILLSGLEASPVKQVDFLSVFSYDLKFYYQSAFKLPDNRCFQVTSANDLSYKTEKIFTVDVVVMEVQ